MYRTFFTYYYDPLDGKLCLDTYYPIDLDKLRCDQLLYSFEQSVSDEMMKVSQTLKVMLIRQRYQHTSPIYYFDSEEKFDRDIFEEYLRSLSKEDLASKFTRWR